MIDLDTSVVVVLLTRKRRAESPGFELIGAGTREPDKQ